MKIGEILRKIADAVDAESTPTVAVAMDHGSHDHEHGAAQSGLVADPEDTFLPPLQMKLELLKKAVGVENIYDSEHDSQDPEASNHKTTPMEPDEQDELNRMRRAAGISAMINTELSDDEPLDN
jgi:hypothetical protein